MLAVVLGAASAVFFGAGDFIGGFASKRITAMLVTGIAALAGVVALTIAAPFDGGIWYAETWIGGIGTGITSCLGIWLLYSAYSVGPMTTLAPVVAIVSTVVPMTAGLLTGETFSSLGWAAVAVGLVAIGLVAAAPDERASKASPVDMVKAALAGAFSVGLAFGDLAVLSVVSGFYPAVTIGLAFVLLRERPNRLQSAGIVLSFVSLAGMALA